MVGRRAVPTESFWTAVRRAYPAERTDSGRPSVGDFESLLLPVLVLECSLRFEDLIPSDDGDDLRVHLFVDPIFGRCMVLARLIDDDTVALVEFESEPF